MGVDVGGGIEVLDKDVIVLTPGCTHDMSLVNVFNVMGLDGVPHQINPKLT
jgi:hypothetical protein